MKIAMSYIDYNMASVAVRESFSFTKSGISELYSKLLKKNDILGAVILATCNRTEIYLSLSEDSKIVPFEVLCECMGLNFREFLTIHKTKHNDKALKHLCHLACGVKSQIWGEDQIVTQVKDAIAFARSESACDSILEVFFRTAVTAAKRVKTEVDFKTDNNSTAKQAVNIIKKFNNINEVLVIGNGVIGRLVTELLLEANLLPTVTLRHYKHSLNIVPKGAKTVDYSLRYEAMENVQAVISATSSPHHTVTLEQLSQRNNMPLLFIDLAMPRDIDSRIEGIRGIVCYNIDEIGREDIKKCHSEQLEEIDLIMQKYIDDFYRWYDYKTRIGERI